VFGCLIRDIVGMGCECPTYAFFCVSNNNLKGKIHVICEREATGMEREIARFPPSKIAAAFPLSSSFFPSSFFPFLILPSPMTIYFYMLLNLKRLIFMLMFV
jgi:hypothetical protein